MNESRMVVRTIIDVCMQSICKRVDAVGRGK